MNELFQEVNLDYSTKMSKAYLTNDSVHWYMDEITSRIVAQSGISSDRYHLGKIILQNFKDDPDFVLQIDGATNESETFGSALLRTVKCATCFQNLGLQQGDVMVLMAPNHIDLNIPFYAALYLGVTVAAIDRTLSTQELHGTFSNLSPKIIFCQSERAPEIQLSLNQLNMDAQIVTFDKGDYLLSFTEFMEKYGDETPIEEFKPADFDPEETTALLIATSGTTGFPKSAAITHKNFRMSLPYVWFQFSNFPTPTRMAMVCSPLQWLAALLLFTSCQIMKITRLQSSQPITEEHVYHLINTYRPTYSMMSPTMMTTIIRAKNSDKCDFTCLEMIHLGGSTVPKELIAEIRRITPGTLLRNVYGTSEVCAIVFATNSLLPGSCGQPTGLFQYRLVDVVTQKDINEPNVPGELWLKGPSVFKGYYRNLENTKEAFADGGWFKSGDLFYRDENWNFFYMERIKMLLKYKSYQISPVEVESVIRKHPGVLDVAVTGIPDPECGELCVACVVCKPECDVTAQEIKDLVKESLSDSKRLRGGVIFLNALPITASTKVNRKKLKEMVLTMSRE